MNDCYLQLQSVDKCYDKIIESIHNRNDWFVKHDFEMVHLSPLVFLHSFLFNIIRKFHGVPVVIKMNPMTWYNWHTDVGRTCTINRLLITGESKTFYGNKLNDNVFDLTELTYEKDRYYLLDTQKPHAVLNLDQPRYVLSIGFRDFDYQTIKKHIEENKL